MSTTTTLSEELLDRKHRALARVIMKIENRHAGYRELVSELILPAITSWEYSALRGAEILQGIIAGSINVLEQRYCLGSRDIQEVVYRSYVLQGCACAGHTFRTLLLRT